MATPNDFSKIKSFHNASTSVVPKGFCQIHGSTWPVSYSYIFTKPKGLAIQLAIGSSFSGAFFQTTKATDLLDAQLIDGEINWCLGYTCWKRLFYEAACSQPHLVYLVECSSYNIELNFKNQYSSQLWPARRI